MGLFHARQSGSKNLEILKYADKKRGRGEEEEAEAAFAAMLVLLRLTGARES